MIFGEYSDIVENYILTMQRFLAVSRFLYSGGWQVWLSVTTGTKTIPFFLVYCRMRFLILGRSVGKETSETISDSAERN